MISASSAHNATHSLFTVNSVAVESPPLSPSVLSSSLKAVEKLPEVSKTGLQTGNPTPSDAASGEPNTSSALALEIDESAAREKQQEDAQLKEDQRVIASLASRDREVKAHEQAHAAVGGLYAGAPSYQYERGPDGVNYAVAGEVSIDIGREATPEATLQKAQVVRRAALAPAEPSPQDRRVAAQATRLESEARVEIRESVDTREEDAKSIESSAPVDGSQDTEAPSASRRVANSGVEAASPSALPEPSSNSVTSRSGILLNQVISNTTINPAVPGDILSRIA